MPPAFRLTPDAQADLISIRRYTVEHWGVAQSEKYLSELRQAIHLLTDSPTLGKPRPDIGPDVLSFHHSSHVIYCVRHHHQLVVFGVLHRRMVPLSHLAEREMI